MKKGVFIAVYGVNNIGKSTHCRILCERLKKAGYDVVSLKYPIYDLDPTGKQLNAILRGTGAQTVAEADLQALFSRNRSDFEPQLRQYLNEGKIVVAEDYIGTGIAWGMAKGMSLKFMEDLNQGLLREDFALLITGHRDARATEKYHIHEQNQNLLALVSKIFIQLSERYCWHVIDLQQNIPDTADLIWKSVRNFLEKGSS
jgi:thymidylate kinase